MIRPFTVVCMLMAVGSGLYLYQCKHQAQVLDREITRTIKETDVARERIGLLRAQWAQLNEPERIAELARAHSSLQNAKPTQFVAANDLAAKLPAPIAPSHHAQSTDVPEDTEAAPPMAQLEPPSPPPVATAAPQPEPKPEPRPVPHAPVTAEPEPMQTPTQTQTLAADPKPSHHAASATPAPTSAVPAAQVAPPQIASVHPLSHPIVPPRSVLQIPVSTEATAPGTIGAAVLRATRGREVHASAPSAEPIVAAAHAYSPPRSAPQPIASSYTPPVYAAPGGGSMLGGAHSALPPPVPFAAR